MDGLARKFFITEDIDAITQAIKSAEKETSGEIRVHIEEFCKNKNVLDRAAKVFAELKIHKTELRNGVLIYLAFRDKKFAIIGDKGINRVVEPNFWDSTRDLMQDYFRKSEFTLGLVDGIKRAGEQLKLYFPYQKDDINELSDEVSFGE
jgi:uncharacterized membrane protein